MSAGIFSRLFRFRRLTTQLAVLFFALVATVLGVFGGMAYGLASLSLETELGRRLESVARLNTPALERMGAEALVPGGAAAAYLKERAQRFAQRADLDGIQILRRDGTVVVDTRDDKAEGRPYDFLSLYEVEWQAALRGETVSTPLFRGRDGKLYKSAFAPIGSGRAAAILKVEASADFLSEVRRFGGSLLMLGLLILAFALLLAWLTSRPIVAPVRDLILASRRVAAGDFNARVEVRRQDEIGQMSETFNEMAEQLGRFIREKERLATLGELAAGVVHEVRNPLAAMEGFAQLIQDEARKGSAIWEYAKEIRNEVRIVNGFLSDFLDYARPREPKLELLDPAEAAVAALSVVFPGDKARQWRLEWGSREALRVRADRDQLRQVMVNLLMNASEATPKGGRIRLSCVSRDGQACLSVDDEGRGIPKQDQVRLFTPFFTTKPMGTGLGLSIAQKIVEGLGGRIEFESEEGRGSTFTVCLPLAMEGI